jgi:hypothetical protein
MTHPITVPLELVEEWGHDANLSGVPYNDEHWAYEQHIATRAAQWGADIELEACCEWLTDWDTCEGERLASLLREGRRPKPPSLKEQALAELEKVDMLWDTTEFSQETLNSLDTIRRALEQLDD